MLAFPYNSKIPAALDALFAAFTAAFANSDPRVFVRDGPWNAGESGGTYAQDIAIGWYGFYPGYQYPTRALSEELGEAAVTASGMEAGWAPSQEENFTVGCASLVMSGADPKPGVWSQLRHLAYANITTAATFIADPQAGGSYLNNTVEKLVIARTNSCHQVAQRRGVLCVVAFSLECTSTTQQLAVLPGRTSSLCGQGPGGLGAGGQGCSDGRPGKQGKPGGPAVERLRTSAVRASRVIPAPGGVENSRRAVSAARLHAAGAGGR